MGSRCIGMLIVTLRDLLKKFQEISSKKKFPVYSHNERYHGQCRGAPTRREGHTRSGRATPYTSIHLRTSPITAMAATIACPVTLSIPISGCRRHHNYFNGSSQYRRASPCDIPGKRMDTTGCSSILAPASHGRGLSSLNWSQALGLVSFSKPYDCLAESSATE